MNKNLNIQLSDLVVQAPGNIVSNMDGEKVMLSIQSGKYYNLGIIGGRILDCIGTPMTVSQIVSILISEYDVDQSVCEEQVKSFLEQLLQESLIQTV